MVKVQIYQKLTKLKLVNKQRIINNNMLKNSPHTVQSITNENWDHPYSREEAVFPEEWLKEFQTGISNKLTLLGYIEGTYEDEYNLHQEFSEERIRKDNEWFEPSPRLKERIKELLEESLEEKKSGIEDLNLEYKEEERGKECRETSC